MKYNRLRRLLTRHGQAHPRRNQIWPGICCCSRDLNWLDTSFRTLHGQWSTQFLLLHLPLIPIPYSPTSRTMPPPKHERYNAKARGSVAGGSAHKKRKRPSTKSIASEHEGAASAAGAEVDFSSGAGKLAREHGLEVEQGMSSKKKKRLDSYIVSDSVPTHLRLFLRNPESYGSVTPLAPAPTPAPAPCR
jgi:hypothetical protein